MSNILEHLDYLLYDNVTPGAHGRDWGIKAATGFLEQDQKLNETFYSYCRMIFDTSPGSLAGFGHAMGGFGIPGSGSYILCVILENKDHVGRDSLAVIGMQFENLKDFSRFLAQYDPVKTAMEVYNQPRPPEKLCPVPIEGTPPDLPDTLFSQWNAKKREDAAFLEKFDKTQSLPLAAGVFSGFLKQSKLPPDILGVTTHLNTELIKRAGFDIAFCKPDSQSTAVILEEILESQSRAVPPPRETNPGKGGKTGPLAVVNYGRPGDYSKAVMAVVSIVFVILFAFSIAYLITHRENRESVPWKHTLNVKKQVQSVTIKKPDPPHKQRDLSTHSTHSTQSRKPEPDKIVSGEEYLDRVKELLDRLETMDPRGPLQSDIYQTIKRINVHDDFKDKRKALLDIIEKELPDCRRRILGIYLGYYFSDKNALKHPAQKRVAMIKQKIGELNLPGNLCDPLKTAFAYQFRRQTDTLIRWCAIISEFRELAE